MNEKHIKIFWFITIFLLMICVCFYSGDNETFWQADKLHEEENFEEGKVVLETLLNELTNKEILNNAGVDMTTPEPINQAIDYFDELLSSLKKIYK